MTNDAGFGKPPRTGQFQPGKSGNPNGRPKNNSLRSDLLEELSESIELTDADGTLVKLSKQRALVKMLMASALQNDKSAIGSLLSFMKFCSVGNDETISETSLDVDRLELLKTFIERAETRIATENKAGSD